MEIRFQTKILERHLLFFIKVFFSHFAFQRYGRLDWVVSVQVIGYLRRLIFQS